MNKSKNPAWFLDGNWGIDTDAYNWTLYRKGEKNWKPAGNYPSAEQLFDSFYQQLSRTELKNPGLIRHVESLSGCVRAAADTLREHLGVRQGSGHKFPSSKEVFRAS